MSSIFSVLKGMNATDKFVPDSPEAIDSAIEALRFANIENRSIYILEYALKKLNLYKRLQFADKDKRVEVINTASAQLESELSISADTVKDTISSILCLIEWQECPDNQNLQSIDDALLRTLADDGDEEAQYHYAMRCYKQKIPGVEKDEQYKDALRYFQPLADNGNTDAQYYCGEIFLWGYGTNQDCMRGLNYCKASAENGNGDALNRIGMLYLLGNSDAGIEPDISTAKNWFLKAAETGLPVAFENVGYIYEQPGTLDMDKSIFYHEKAANLGSASAQRHLGYIFDYNKNYEDFERARFWYEKAAAQGNPAALNNLGVMYLDGRGVAINLQKATAYFVVAAEQGFTESQYELGAIYNRGKEYQKAAYWYKKASKSGHILASNNLGTLYGDGHLGTPNYLLAYCYCKKAANAGDGTAKANAEAYIRRYIQQNAPFAVNVKTFDDNLDWYIKTYDSDDPIQAEVDQLVQNAFQEAVQGIRQEQNEKQQHETDTLHCPSCKSTQVTAKTRGFRLGKALLGGALFGGVGLLGGTVGSNDTRMVCLKCGYEWTPGSLVSLITDAHK